MGSWKKSQKIAKKVLTMENIFGKIVFADAVKKALSAQQPGG